MMHYESSATVRDDGREYSGKHARVAWRQVGRSSTRSCETPLILREASDEESGALVLRCGRFRRPRGEREPEQEGLVNLRRAEDLKAHADLAGLRHHHRPEKKIEVLA